MVRRSAPEAIVLDSSFLVAWHNSRDVHHAAAARTMVEIVAGTWGRALLLEYVFLEVVTVLLVRRGHAVAAAAATALLGAAEVDFVPCSSRFPETLDVFTRQRSGRLSFADAAIVAVARRDAGGRVATFDTDFAGEAGLTIVPA